MIEPTPRSNNEYLKLAIKLEDTSKALASKISYNKAVDKLQKHHLKDLLTLPSLDIVCPPALQKAVDLCKDIASIFNSDKSLSQNDYKMMVRGVEESIEVANWTSKSYEVTISIEGTEWSLQCYNAKVVTDESNESKFGLFENIVICNESLSDYLYKDDLAIHIAHVFLSSQLLSNCFEFGEDIEHTEINVSHDNLEKLFTIFSEK